MKKLASFLSAIFHPLILPTYAIILIYYSPTYLQMEAFEIKRAVFVIVFLISFISPLLSIFLLVSFRVVSDIFMTEKKERIMPLITVFFFYLAGYFIMQKFPMRLSYYITSFLLVSAMVVVVTFFINFITKISIHTISIGSFLGFGIIFCHKMGIDAFYFTTSLIFISSIVAFARLYLKAHTPFQVYLGFFTGLLIGLSSLFY